MGRCDGKVALVTGADRGIGKAIAHRLAQEGATVAVHYGFSADQADQVVHEITERGGTAVAVHTLFGRPDDGERLRSALTEQLATVLGAATAPRVDILVNNAATEVTAPPSDLDPADVDHLMRVNAQAPLHIVRALEPLIPDGGRIINISSGLTRFANPPEVANAMAKAALEMVTLHFAKHLGPRGITVNTVAPGVVDTGHPGLATPAVRRSLSQLSVFGRLATPADIAPIVAFLASPEARMDHPRAGSTPPEAPFSDSASLPNHAERHPMTPSAPLHRLRLLLRRSHPQPVRHLPQAPRHRPRSVAGALPGVGRHPPTTTSTRPSTTTAPSPPATVWRSTTPSTRK